MFDLTLVDCIHAVSTNQRAESILGTHPGLAGLISLLSTTYKKIKSKY